MSFYKFLLKKARTLEFTNVLAFKITGDERIELPLKVLETSVIPFDQSPIFNSISNIEKRRNRNYVLFLIYLQNFTQMITSYFPKNLFFSVIYRLSPRPISNSQLHTLLCFHLCPIYLVVFKGSYSRRRDISS